MGEAKRKAGQLESWHASLSADEKSAAEVSWSLFRKFVAPLEVTGMCYRLSFLLTEILQNERGVQVQPVIGYINDGTTQLMASHAWVEMSGKRIDLSLAFTEHPDVQLPGEVLILDRVIRTGVRYSYSTAQSNEAIQALNRLSTDPQFALLAAHKESEHSAMLNRSKTSALRRSFLDSVPDPYTYERIVSLIL